MAQEDFSLLFGGTPGAPASALAAPVSSASPKAADQVGYAAAATDIKVPPKAAAPPSADDYSLLFGGTPGAKSQQPEVSAGTHPLFGFLLNQESGNKQLDSSGRPITSPKGAIGVAQVMPGTAPEAAKLAGLQYDEMRYRNDKSYNMALGNAYFNKQLDDFGDDMKALAAYNAGPRAVQNAERRAKMDGNPDAWLRFMPEETKKYVPAIMGAAQRAGVDLSAAAARSNPQADPTQPAVKQDEYRDPYSSVVATPRRSLTQVAKDGFSSGLESSKGLAAGVGALISATLGNNPDDGYTKTLLDYAKSQSEKSSKLQGDAASFTDAMGEGGDLGRWAANAAGYLGYQMVESIATGGTGAIMGKMIGKPVVGAFASSMVEKEIGRMVASGAEKTLTKNELSAVAAGTVAKKMGAASAIFANNIRQEGGSVYGDAIEEAQKTGNPMPGFGQIWLASLAAAGLDTAGELMMAKGMLGFKEGSTASTYARRAAVEVPKGIGIQGGTEVGQTVIEQLGANKDPLKPENIKDTIDSGAMGAFGGSMGSLVTASHKRDAAAAAAVSPAVPVNPALAAATTHAATPNSPLSRATVAGNSPESQAAKAAEQQAGQPAAPVDPSARLAELQAIADGVPPQFTPDGQPVQGTGNQGRRYFTADEKAEFDHLREMKAATEDASSTAAPAVDPISDRVTQITEAMRTGGLLQQVRDAGGDTKSLLNDLATAQSKSTNASQREQAMSRVEFALGFANDIPPAGPTAAAPNANPIIAALTDPKLSPGDRQALQAAHQASQNPALPAGTRANALSTAQEIVGRNAAPLSNSVEFGGIKTQAVAAPITPVAGSTEESMREGQRQQAGADQFTAAGYTEEAAAHQQLADSANEEAATRREEAAIAARVDDVPAPKVAVPAGSGTATMRKRKATLHQLVGTGLTRVDRRADGFYMTSENGRRQFKLDGPADAQLARAAINENIRAGADMADQGASLKAKIARRAKLGRINIGGLSIAIESQIGSTREGTDPSGKKWSVRMTSDYGDIDGTTGADGDGVDVYVAPNPRQDSPVFVIDQYNADGKFDETKTVLGVATPEAATKIYDAHFSDGSGPSRRRAVTQMTVAEFKTWANSPAARKPAEGTHGTAGSDRDAGAAGSRPPGVNQPARGMGGGSQPEVLSDETDATGEDEDGTDSGQPEGRDVAADVVANQPAADSLTVRIDGKQETLKKLAVDTFPDVDSSDRGGKARKVSKKAGKLLQAVGKAFGKEVTFFDDAGKKTGDGFVVSNDPNNIYLNQSTGITPLNVFSHELVHQLERDNPEAHAALKAVVAARMNEKAAPEMGRYYDHADILDELTSDLGGDLMSDPTFWQEVFAKIEADNGKDATGIIARMAELIYRAIDAMGVNLRPYGASALVNDMEGIRSAFRDTMAQYVQDKGISKAAMQAQILRAGQEATRSSAEQQRESNDAAERGRRAAGDRARARAWTDNPMRAFIAKHGISLDLASEWAPGLTERRQALVQGYGPIFRRNGLSIDMLAQAAVEEGFLLEPDVPALEELIDKAIRKQRVTPQYAEGVAESEMEARIARQREFEEDAEAALSAKVFTESDLIELADANIPWGASSNTSTTDAMRSMGFTEQEIEDEIKREARVAESSSKGGSGPVENPSKSADGADPGPDRQASAGGQLDKRSADRIDQTLTAAFKKWFGASKVVDENGKPLVVYHGTAADISDFRASDGWYGPGVYFTPSAEVAGDYAERKADQKVDPSGANVVAAHLALQNPYEFSVPEGGEVSSDQQLLRELGLSDKRIAKAARDYNSLGYVIRNLLEERGHDGLIVRDEVEGDEFVAFNANQIKSSIGNNGNFEEKHPNITRSAERERVNDFEMSTRAPSAKPSKTFTPEDARENLLISNFEAGLDQPKWLSAVTNLVEQYPNYRPADTATTDEKKLERLVRQMASNLTWLHDQVPEEIRDRSQRWYDGANVIANRIAKRNDISEAQAAGILAVLSPQKDWFMNVSLAERVAAAMTDRQNFRWSTSMEETASRIFGQEKYQEDLADIKGKTLADLDTDYLRAMWIRTYDEAHNPRSYMIVSPEGEAVGEAKTGKGELAKPGWGGLVTIAKAVAIYRDGSMDSISSELGLKHKVRNFYNNILVPNSPNGHVTIDTHAVAAALLRPLSGNSIEVIHNFGGPSSAAVGLEGTYALYEEAYHRAASGLGLLPRQLQSITWEAIRGLFTPGFKSQAKNVAEIDKIWNQFKKGRLSHEDARDWTREAGGGIENPSWVGRGAGSDVVEEATADQGDVSGDELSGRRASMERGIGEFHSPSAAELAQDEVRGKSDPKRSAFFLASEQTKSLKTQQTVSSGVPSIRPEALIEMRKRDSILKSLMKCLG